MSVALVVLDNATGEVLARVASPDYFDARRAGAVDLTQAVRSPGSALKPFIYGLGFEDGLIHPESLIEDRPIRYADYAPENFDLTFQGTVTVRRALQLSLNVPAVAVLDEVGPSRLIARLAEAGAPLVLPRSEAPGLALGLGGVGVRLTDLTMLYAGLARQGTVAPLIERLGAAPLPPRAADRAGGRLVCRQCAARHAAAGERRRRADRLQDRHELRLSRRLGDRLRRQAHHRGVDRAGRTARRLRGWWGASAPRRSCSMPSRGLGQGYAAAAADAERARSSPPPPSCRRRCSASRPARARARPWRPRCISCSRRTARASNWPGVDGEKPDPIAIKIAGGIPPLNVLLNGMPLAAKKSARTLFFEPDGPGFVRLTVTDATGAADSVVVRLQ